MQYLINKKDEQKFNAIKNYIEAQSQNLKGITANQFGTIMSCIIDLLEFNKTSTIDTKIMEVFKKYEFNISESGIGWEITV